MRESAISREIVTFLRSVGFAVWDTGQGYRRDRGGTRVTPGLADLVILGHGRVCFAEIKRPKETLRPSQVVFRDECRANGVEWHLWRDVREVFDWLVDIGILEAA